MTLSIEVLPAPFGPMMARISPLRISNETPVTAFTPPKASDTFSTESNTSPATTSCPLGALMSGPQFPSRAPSASCRPLQVASDRDDLEIPNLDPGGQRALAAVL